MTTAPGVRKRLPNIRIERLDQQELMSNTIPCKLRIRIILINTKGKSVFFKIARNIRLWMYQRNGRIITPSRGASLPTREALSREEVAGVPSLPDHHSVCATAIASNPSPDTKRFKKTHTESTTNALRDCSPLPEISGRSTEIGTL